MYKCVASERTSRYNEETGIFTLRKHITRMSFNPLFSLWEERNGGEYPEYAKATSK